MNSAEEEGGQEEGDQEEGSQEEGSQEEEKEGRSVQVQDVIRGLAIRSCAYEWLA